MGTQIYVTGKTVITCSDDGGKDLETDVCFLSPDIWTEGGRFGAMVCPHCSHNAHQEKPGGAGVTTVSLVPRSLGANTGARGL